MTQVFDVAVVGGGLAGLTAANKLGIAGKKTILFDRPVEEANGKLGGFAEFSGAKFSLPPAGQGLLPVVGGEGPLRKDMNEALKMLGLLDRVSAASEDVSFSTTPSDLQFRRYESIVLLPDEMSDLVTHFGEETEKVCTVVRQRVEAIENSDLFLIRTEDCCGYHAKTVLYAGGRAGTELLNNMGAVAQNGKGLDVGIRLEFGDGNALKGLRDLGPDAKIISGRTRTFCLNVPGRIFYYDYNGVKIPGGVVASPDEKSGNVGVLCRLPNKGDELPRILEATRLVQHGHFIVGASPQTGLLADKSTAVREVFGNDVHNEIEAFLELLSSKHLINFRANYSVHFPLIDWHWPVFAVGHTHQTSVEGLFVTGDTSGHARGLLQAAVSGLVSAREILDRGI